MILFHVHKLTTTFKKMTIMVLLFSSLTAMAHEKIVLGITGVALKNDISTLVKFKNYLRKKTGFGIKLKFARSYSIMRHLILENNVNVAYICGATYVDLEPSKKIELLALPTLEHQPYYYSLVIAKKGTNYKSIDDFKDKVYAMSDPESNSGSLVPRYEIIKRGYDEDHFFKRIIYTYDHGESILAVLDNYVQGASVDSVIYGAFLRNHPKSGSQLRIVQKFGPYPITPIVISKNVPKKIKNMIQKALIRMGDDKSGKEILNAMAIDSFIKPNHLSYKKIEDVKSFLRDEK